MVLFSAEFLEVVAMMADLASRAREKVETALRARSRPRHSVRTAVRTCARGAHVRVSQDNSETLSPEKVGQMVTSLVSHRGLFEAATAPAPSASAARSGSAAAAQHGSSPSRIAATARYDCCRLARNQRHRAQYVPRRQAAGNRSGAASMTAVRIHDTFPRDDGERNDDPCGNKLSHRLSSSAESISP